MSEKTSKSPLDCSEAELCQIKTSTLDTKEFWILRDGFNVSIVKQRIGESSTESVRVPIDVFRKMVKWMTTPQEFIVKE